MLRTENIGYWYNEEQQYLFKDISIEFEAGKVYGILGSSGSGKTTFLSLIAGLDTPKQGTIYYQDTPLTDIGLRNFRQKDVSIVFQAYNLLPYMSALDNLLTAMAIAGFKEANAEEYALKQLERVGIDESLSKRPVTQLSGGQQQRVAIARALSCNHQLIVADEPTGNLDEETSREIVKLFQAVAHEQKRCIIIVTHEQEVARACDEVYELKQKVFQVKEMDSVGV